MLVVIVVMSMLAAPMTQARNWSVAINNGVSPHYIMLNDGRVFGNYSNQTDPFSTAEPIYIGNFWSDQIPPATEWVYHVRMAGTDIVNHFVYIPNGEIYGRTTGVMTPFTTDPPTYIGNMLEGVVAVDPSSWGEIKSQFE